MALLYVKPWPPVKPMDPVWLEAYGMAASELSFDNKEKIMMALDKYSNESNASAEALNNALLKIVPMPHKGEKG